MSRCRWGLTVSGVCSGYLDQRPLYQRKRDELEALALQKLPAVIITETCLIRRHLNPYMQFSELTRPSLSNVVVLLCLSVTGSQSHEYAALSIKIGMAKPPGADLNCPVTANNGWHPLPAPWC